MGKNMLKRISISLMLTAALPVQAEVTPVQHLQNFLAHARTLRAEFSQVLVDDKGGADKQSSGMFYLERPGKFRWDYQSPYQQEIVASGGKVWFYDKDLEQVTAKRLNAAIGSTPALLLSGEVPLEQNFKVEDQEASEGLYWIRLVPKSPDSGFQQLLIGLEGDVLAGMQLTDNFGQYTRIYFRNVRLGARHDAALFELKAPPGVDVFEEK